MFKFFGDFLKVAVPKMTVSDYAKVTVAFGSVVVISWMAGEYIAGTLLNAAQRVDETLVTVVGETTAAVLG